MGVGGGPQGGGKWAGLAQVRIMQVRVTSKERQPRTMYGLGNV